MGTFTAKDVIDRATYLLKDDDNVRWERAEMLRYVNEAERAIVRLQPAANYVKAVVKLSEGTDQHIPEDGLSLLTVIRNVDDEGFGGDPVRLATRSIFDSMMSWHSAKEKTVVENYIYDDRTSTEFSVYPPNDGFGLVELVYSKLPQDIAEGDRLALGDEYFTPTVNYVMYKCALLDSDFNGTGQLAQFYYQQFVAELNGQAAAGSKEGPLPAHQPGPIAANGGTE